MRRLWREVVRTYHLLARRERIGIAAVLMLAVGLLGWIGWTELGTPARERVSLTRMIEDSRNGLIKSAQLSEHSVDLAYDDGKDATFKGQVPDDTIIALVQSGVDVSFADSSLMDFFSKHGYPLLMLIPMALIVWHVLGGASRFAIGGPTKLLDRTAASYRFADVAGQDEAKEQMSEIVEFLRDPQTYTRLGAKAPKGALMVGPPGVGKTLLA